MKNNVEIIFFTEFVKIGLVVFIIFIYLFPFGVFFFGHAVWLAGF